VAGKLDAPDYAAWSRRFDRVLCRKSDRRGITLRSALWLLCRIRHNSHNPIAIKRLLVDLFVEAHEHAPDEIVLDLDATDDPVHGEQEGRFFHG
jgi:Transposase DDE domain group 1